jgi:hypothetical protein
LLLLVIVTTPAFAGFREVEMQLRTQLGRPIYIPFLGVARFAAWVVHPHGVRDFQLATWETRRSEFDGDEIEAAMKKGLSSDFQPLVRVKSRREWTLIYARAVGDRFEIIVVNHDRSDTVLVRADIDAEQLSRTIAEKRLARLH